MQWGSPVVRLQRLENGLDGQLRLRELVVPVLMQRVAELLPTLGQQRRHRVLVQLVARDSCLSLSLGLGLGLLLSAALGPLISQDWHGRVWGGRSQELGRLGPGLELVHEQGGLHGGEALRVEPAFERCRELLLPDLLGQEDSGQSLSWNDNKKRSLGWPSTSGITREIIRGQSDLNDLENTIRLNNIDWTVKSLANNDTDNDAVVTSST